jgi:hypothetical protein
MESGGLLLPGAPRTAKLCFRYFISRRIKQRSRQLQKERCRSHLCFGPITAEPCRAKTTPLPHTSILFRPHIRRQKILPVFWWWRRRVLPPGPFCLFHAAFIAIAGIPAWAIYSRNWVSKVFNLFLLTIQASKRHSGVSRNPEPPGHRLWLWMPAGAGMTL